MDNITDDDIIRVHREDGLRFRYYAHKEKKNNKYYLDLDFNG